jgi:hypothetical protein
MVLMLEHVRSNIRSLQKAEENIRTGLIRPQLQIPQSNSPYQGDPIFTERAFIYVENI